MAVKRGRGRGEPENSPRRVNGKVRRIDAVKLRGAGATYEMIAEQLGFRDRAAAFNAVRAALDEWEYEAAEVYRRIELMRREALLLELEGHSRHPNSTQADKIRASRAKNAVMDSIDQLLGLRAPLRVDMSVVEAEIANLARELRVDPKVLILEAKRLAALAGAGGPRVIEERVG